MSLSYSDIRSRCLKPDEAIKPLYARVVTHWFSTRFVWLIQGAPVSPNQLTLVSLTLACASLPFFAHLTPRSALIGALLVEAYYVFDAVDGQWARLTGKKSLTGAFFDYLVNYALQPPLLFAIGWGVYGLTGDAFWLLLGFLAGFSTLWLILIWNLRASVLLSHLAHKGKAPAGKMAGEDAAAGARQNPLRSAFSWLHKIMVFPWFMNVLTACSTAAFVADTATDSFLTLSVFQAFLLFYGFGGAGTAVLLTAHWILSKKIDSSPELG